jgi:hypothetical protein
VRVNELDIWSNTAHPGLKAVSAGIYVRWLLHRTGGLHMHNKISISFPELGLLAATRGMIGAGLGLLLANRLSREKRKAIGLPLFIIGALSTIPIAMRVFHKGPSEMEQ